MTGPPATDHLADDYHRHAVWLRKLAGGLVNDPAAADDLVQETWLAALRGKGARGSAVRPWLRAVLVNTARRVYRTNDRRSIREELAHDGAQHLPSAAELAESNDLAQALMEEVHALPEPLSTALRLRYMEGLRSVEIARRSDQPVGTVRWRLAEARKELRARMDRRLGTRRAWAGLALPLGLQLDTAAIRAKSLTSVKTGARATMLVESGARIALGLACLLAMAGAWLVLRPETDSGATGTEIALSPMATPTDSAPLAPDPTKSAERIEIATATLPEAEARSAQRPGTPPARMPRLERDQVGVLLAVLDDEGQTVQHATLRWDGSHAAVASTDQNGVAQLLFRPPVSGAQLRFRVEARGFTDRIIEKTLRTGTATWLGEITLTRAIERTGRVVNEEGLPIKGARVLVAPVGAARAPSPGFPSDRHASVAPAGWSELSVDPMFTDRRGRFVFPKAPAKVHCVWAVAEGHWYTGSDPIAPQNLKPVTVVLKKLPDAASISGRVVDVNSQPLGDVLLRLTPESVPASTKQKAEELETEADGTFRFRLRHSGSYRIEAEDLLDRWDNLTVGGLRSGTRSLEIRLKVPL